MGNEQEHLPSTSSEIRKTALGELKWDIRFLGEVLFSQEFRDFRRNALLARIADIANDVRTIAHPQRRLRP